MTSYDESSPRPPSGPSAGPVLRPAVVAGIAVTTLLVGGVAGAAVGYAARPESGGAGMQRPGFGPGGGGGFQQPPGLRQAPAAR